jgi:hypothetical protein
MRQGIRFQVDGGETMSDAILSTVCHGTMDLLEALMAQYRAQEDPHLATLCKIAGAHIRTALLYGDLDRMEDAMEGIDKAQEIIMEILKDEGGGAGPSRPKAGGPA